MNQFRTILCLLLLSGGLLACQAKVAPSVTQGAQAHVGGRQHIIKNINADELARILKTKKDIILLDVREKGEYMEGHIKGAKLIPWMQLRTRYTELDSNKEIVLYCRSGRRSKIAGTILIHNGFSVTHVGGGLLEWQTKKYPVETGMSADAF
jgi:rhodanese-related sulfurtransferase